jgi:hypothetical protein
MAIGLGAVCFLSLLVGSILTYRQTIQANRSGDLDVCLAGAEAAAIVDFGRDAVSADDLSESFLTLERVSDDLPWEAACRRVVKSENGLDVSDVEGADEDLEVTKARIAALDRIVSNP